MSSLRDLGFQSAPTPTYTTTMPRGPFLQRHFSGISSHDLQNNNEPPPIRPRKPPRLIHYAQGGTLTRNNFTLGKILVFLGAFKKINLAEFRSMICKMIMNHCLLGQGNSPDFYIMLKVDQ